MTCEKEVKRVRVVQYRLVLEHDEPDVLISLMSFIETDNTYGGAFNTIAARIKQALKDIVEVGA